MAIINYIGDRYAGLSTDTKPTNVADGAVFDELNTAKIYQLYNGVWQEVTNLSSSGSSGSSGQTISGSSGTSGQTVNGSSGTSGETISGSSGTSGQTIAGSSGSSGQTISGSSGTSSTAGSSGSSGASISITGNTNTLVKFASPTTITNSIFVEENRIQLTTSGKYLTKLGNDSDGDNTKVWHYENLAGLSNENGGSLLTGVCRIVSPSALGSAWNAHNHIRIDGYDYTASGAWSLLAGGYFQNIAGNSWINTSASLQGTAPFSGVRFGYSGDYNWVILLGETGTIWNRPKIVVSDVIVGGTNFEVYSGNFYLDINRSDTEITVSSTPSILPFNGENGSSGSSGETISGSSGTSGQTISGSSGTSGQTISGSSGSSGQSGNSGNASFIYNFSTSTTDADPGSGFLRFSDIDPFTTATIFIDDEEDGATDIQAYLRTLDDSTNTIKGSVKISKRYDETKFAIFNLTAITEATGYFKLTVGGAIVASAGTPPFANNDEVVFSFTRAGDQGSHGTSSTAGSSGSSGQTISGSSGTSGQTISGSSGSSGQTISGSSGSSGTSVAVAGTANTLTKFTSATTIGDSIVTEENGVQVVIGNTTTPGKTLTKLGGSDGYWHYENVAGYSNDDGIPDGRITGVAKITYPMGISLGRQMQNITLQGFSLSANQTWELMLGGYSNIVSGNPWFSFSSAKLKGSAPFSGVRFGISGNAYHQILLGTTDTVWIYPKIAITDIFAGFSNQSQLSGAFGLTISDNEQHFQVDETLTVYPLTDGDGDTGKIPKFTGRSSFGNSIITESSGKIGINTSGPDAILDVLGVTTQLRLTYTDGAIYADFTMNSDGDLIMNVDGVSNQLVLDNGGNVGIGTTGPTNNLEVWGTAAAPATSGTAQNGVIRWSSSSTNTSLDMGVEATAFYSWIQSRRRDNYATNLNLALQPNGGNVGINTTGPDAKLDVLSTTEQLRLTYTDGTVYSSFTVNSSGYLTINPSGERIGIGTASPVSILEIQGGLTTTGAILTLGTKETTVVVNDILGRINFYAPLEGSGADAQLVSASIVAIAESEFFSNSNATSLIFQTGSSEVATTKMAVTSAGNVGIGTTGPDAKLDVLATTEQLRLTYTDGSVYSSFTVNSSGNLSIGLTGTKLILDADLEFTGAQAINTSTGALNIQNAGNVAFNSTSGNVGIGGLGVDSKLDVIDATITQLRLSYTSDSVYTNFQTGSDGDLTISPTGGDVSIINNLKLGTASTNGSLTIFNSGGGTEISLQGGAASYLGINQNIGIGTTGPDAKLDVLSTSTQLRLTYTDGSVYTDITTSLSGHLIITPSGGRVGIGTSGPDAKLDVLATTTQLRLTYTDGSVYTDLTVDSSGNLSVSPTGTKLSTTKALHIGTNEGLTDSQLVIISGGGATLTLHNYEGVGSITSTSGKHAINLILTETNQPTASLDVTTPVVSQNSERINFKARGFNQTITSNLSSAKFNQFLPSVLGGAAETFTTNAATVYIEGATIESGVGTIHNNYALWVSGGLSKFGGDIVTKAGATGVSPIPRQISGIGTNFTLPSTYQKIEFGTSTPQYAITQTGDYIINASAAGFANLAFPYTNGFTVKIIASGSNQKKELSSPVAAFWIKNNILIGCPVLSTKTFLTGNTFLFLDAEYFGDIGGGVITPTGTFLHVTGPF